MRVLLTGAAGFIGFHTAQRLLREGHQVCGFDNLNTYYEPKHKLARLDILKHEKNFSFIKGDLCDNQALTDTWQSFAPTHVLHLAAQAGVRYSLENPSAYIQSNIVGFQNVIELVRRLGVENFVYASSSSVYGGNKEYPFKETQDVSKPVSLYAATKKSNELVAHTYVHLFKIPATGLRFFTVYGPFSRPDMAMYKFANLMRLGKPIEVYNSGKMVRDFTYVDDIVDGVISSLSKPFAGEVFNLGRSQPMELDRMVSLLEEALEIKAKRELKPMQQGDVEMTLADISKAKKMLGYDPKTSLEQGVGYFAKWFRTYDRH